MTTSLWLLLLLSSLSPQVAGKGWPFGGLRAAFLHQWRSGLQPELQHWSASSDRRSWVPPLGTDDLDDLLGSALGLGGGKAGSVPLDETDVQFVRRQLGPDNEEWSQRLTWQKLLASGDDGFDIVSLAHAVFDQGFSVIVNKVNHRWEAVGTLALELQRILGHTVNVNLYAARSAGFEAHFDYMHSVVVQLEGSKRWRTFAPLVRWPRPDQKYKPRAEDLGPAASIVLEPGDVLWMPAGVPHECEVVSSGPSLHLTFGVEVDPRFSVEGYLERLALILRGGERGGDDVAGLLALAVRTVADRDAALRRPLYLPERSHLVTGVDCGVVSEIVVNSTRRLTEHGITLKMVAETARLALRGFEKVDQVEGQDDAYSTEGEASRAAAELWFERWSLHSKSLRLIARESVGTTEELQGALARLAENARGCSPVAKRVLTEIWSDRYEEEDKALREQQHSLMEHLRRNGGRLEL